LSSVPSTDNLTSHMAEHSGNPTPSIEQRRAKKTTLFTVTTLFRPKTGGTASTWDAGAVSTRAILSGDGYVQATVDALNTYRMFGLSNGAGGVKFTDIVFAAYMSGITLIVYERGLYKGSFNALHVGH